MNNNFTIKDASLVGDRKYGRELEITAEIKALDSHTEVV